MNKWHQFKFVCFLFVFLSGCLFVFYTLKEYQALGWGMVPITTVHCVYEKGAPFLADFLAESLGLDGPEPVLMKDFSVTKATRKLVEIPVLKSSAVKVIKPGVISVEYMLRTPVAFIGDLENHVFDCEGGCFPFSPFYTPRGLPEVFFGLLPQEKAHPKDLCLPNMEYVLDLIHYFKERPGLGQLLRITVSNMQKSNSFKKEIIVECVANFALGPEKHVLRIHPENYEVAKREYLALVRALQDKIGKETSFLPYESLESAYRIIDLRAVGKALLLTNLDYEG